MIYNAIRNNIQIKTGNGLSENNTLKLVNPKECVQPLTSVFFSFDSIGNIIVLDGNNLEKVDIYKENYLGHNISHIHASENKLLAHIYSNILKKKTESTTKINGIYLEVFYIYQYNCGGQLTGIMGAAKSVSSAINIDDKLKLKENYFTNFFENSPEAAVILDNEDRIINVNDSFEKLFQFNLKEIKGHNIHSVIVPPEFSEDASGISGKVKFGETINTETVRMRKDGKKINVSVLGFPVVIGDDQAGIFGIYNDISQRKKSEEQIKNSLLEKEILLKEIHHRVKNNLQIIGSLLNFQSRFIKDQDSLHMFMESQSRVKSIALIHDKLYQTKNLSRIEITNYLQSLASHLFKAYGIDTNRIALKINANNIFLSVDNAIPSGLIINEIVTNSLKYAFPDGRAGEVSIDLKYADTKYILTIKDNGIGIPEHIDISNADTLGLQLVYTLVSQLEAEMTCDRTAGTKYTITFSNLNYEERI